MSIPRAFFSLNKEWQVSSTLFFFPLLFQFGVNPKTAAASRNGVRLVTGEWTRIRTYKQVSADTMKMERARSSWRKAVLACWVSNFVKKKNILNSCCWYWFFYVLVLIVLSYMFKDVIFSCVNISPTLLFFHNFTTCTHWPSTFGGEGAAWGPSRCSLSFLFFCEKEAELRIGECFRQVSKMKKPGLQTSHWSVMVININKLLRLKSDKLHLLNSTRLHHLTLSTCRCSMLNYPDQKDELFLLTDQLRAPCLWLKEKRIHQFNHFLSQCLNTLVP